jgi:hypothetical protein
MDDQKRTQIAIRNVGAGLPALADKWICDPLALDHRREWMCG